MMISRTAFKLVGSNGRSGKSCSFAALAKRKENEAEISEANSGSNLKIKTGKKIPIAQRRAMIQVFVDKYRALNNGKLPGVCKVVNEVGGSYYVVKNIFQELVSRIKIPAISQSALREEPVHREEYSRKAKVIRNGGSSDSIISISSEKDIEPERGSQASSSTEMTFSKQDGFSELNVEQNSQDIKENTIPSSCTRLDVDKAERAVSDDGTPTDLQENKQKETGVKGDTFAFGSEPGKLLKTKTSRNKDVSKGKAGKHEETHKEKPSGSLSSKPSIEPEETKKKPTLWGNLKSFADGIMNIWRKS